MIVKLLTEHYLEFLSLKGDCRASSESTHAKLSNCWNLMPWLISHRKQQYVLEGTRHECQECPVFLMFKHSVIKE